MLSGSNGISKWNQKRTWQQQKKQKSRDGCHIIKIIKPPPICTADHYNFIFFPNRSCIFLPLSPINCSISSVNHEEYVGWMFIKSSFLKAILLDLSWCFMVGSNKFGPQECNISGIRSNGCTARR